MARRPLQLEELREAIAIKRFAHHSKPERFVVDPSRIIAWCEGLLSSQEDGEVHFAQRTVRTVLARGEIASECYIDVDSTSKMIESCA